MSTLGQYLRAAREARGLDLRDAAQQTRISINYLKALEQEDFSRLPGEVFVKGFLKNYAKFLSLDENEVLKKYLELKPPQPVVAPGAVPEPAAPPRESAATHKTPIEPLIWGAGIVIALAAFLFTAMPQRHETIAHRPAAPESAPEAVAVPQQGQQVPAAKPEKLYLEVIAQESTWVLVRTDNSPQKKAVLKVGENLIWSADERFLLSYGSAGALLLKLNGQELTVNEPKNAVVRDLAITAAGIVSRKGQPVAVKPARQPVPQQVRSAVQTTVTNTQRPPVAASPVKPQPSQLPWETNQSSTPQ